MLAPGWFFSCPVICGAQISVWFSIILSCLLASPSVCEIPPVFFPPFSLWGLCEGGNLHCVAPVCAAPCVQHIVGTLGTYAC